MAGVPRYEIVDTIASGDFGTVYRARDRELGREVAIKQIHQQFLTDPRQLERYWKEAQLLASLQHPNIVTIYDIDRSRGWLILELMRGSLRQTLEAGPLDLDFLRVAMAGSLNALQFLHNNGVIHGDVKPSNMLVDSQARVKLGDFGLARRASSEEGSLLKGTTKYMAPELVSPQFGPIGPASDLYSLGFSCYELICGPQFESLFPGLATHGRDKQIAWMMWHAAADRQLPEISRVLEGVPPDLAKIIERLVAKDQRRRYQTAGDVIRDLKADTTELDAPTEKEDPEEIARREREAKKKRLVRIGAIAALACSVLLSIVMLLPKKKAPPPAGPTEVAGVITNVYLNERKLALKLDEDGSAKEFALSSWDQYFVNGRSQLLRDLKPNDHVTLEFTHDDKGRRITKVYATRPEESVGLIASIEADEGHFALAVGEGPDKGKQLDISVPIDLGEKEKILFNGSPQIDGRPVTLGDLAVDDRITVRHIGTETGREATEMRVLRVVTFEGVVRDVATEKGELTFARNGDDTDLVTMSIAPGCEVTINDLRSFAGKAIKASDLKPGDKATVSHDVQIVRVEAHRILGEEGTLTRIEYGARTMEVKRENPSEQKTFLVRQECEITLGGEKVELDDLRVGDIVDITHDTPDPTRTPEALKILARRPADPNRWAIVIGNQNYEDLLLGEIDWPVADATAFRETLIKRYSVPSNQALLLTDESLVRLEQGIPGLLNRIGPEGQVLIYYAGHAFKDTKGAIYLAPKNFDSARIAQSGLGLQWLVDQFEKCAAKKKLLLLDCSPAASKPPPNQPSTTEMLRTLKSPGGRAPLRTVTAIASCNVGERGLYLPAKKHSVFAYALIQGFSGKADKNRDGRLEVTELFSFLKDTMATAGSDLAKTQTPVLFLANNKPPRLSDDAKAAIRRLASFLRQDKIDLDAATEQYDRAVELAKKELEPELVYGLVLLKAKQRQEAFQHWEQVKINHPNLLLPLQSMAWIRFDKRTYASGVEELTELATMIPKPKPGEALPEETRQVLDWIGQLREFAAVVPEGNWRAPERSCAKLDAAVAEHGDEAIRLYTRGRSRTKSTLNDYDRRISTAENEPTQKKLKIDRRTLKNYTQYPFDEIVQRILAGLDR